MTTDLSDAPSEAVRAARAALQVIGYTSHLRLTDDDLLCCPTCGVCHDPTTLTVGHPGMQTTGDGMLVVPLVCSCCRGRAVAIVPAHLRQLFPSG